MRSRIEPMKRIAMTLRSHRALILNYFRARMQFSSGMVEGLNNMAKLTMRKILRLPHLPRHRNRAVSRTWQTTGGSRHP
jgi:transposase